MNNKLFRPYTDSANILPGRVWAWDLQGVFSQPEVHANGHTRPKSVIRRTKAAALLAWLVSIEANIDAATRLHLLEERKTLRQLEKEARRQIKQNKTYNEGLMNGLHE